MTLDDWRDANSTLVAGLYEDEQRRWQRELAWDTCTSWAIVEAGRQRGDVLGWILRDQTGEVRGWTYYVLFEGELQIGALSADRAIDVRELLDGVLGSPEASLASSISCFVYPAPASLLSALRRRRFSVRRSLYLTLPLGADTFDRRPGAAGLRMRPYRSADMLGAVRLLASAYDGAPGAVCFAPHGRLDEWVRYLRQLIERQSCGRFLPEASFVADDPSSGRLLGAVLTTALSPGTAHIAQVVVGPQNARQGVGRTLLSQAFAAAGQAGYSSITLMVDEGNAPARTLYARQGFVECSAFASARRAGLVRINYGPSAGRRLAV
ncbi:MAG: GNAT family N-acetyltransferase [Acidobacteria bacterium]|nr:GNAT family N-acetyltransferase [Acidobacteriota bacterium]